MPDLKVVTVENGEIQALEAELAAGRQQLNELNARGSELAANLLRLEGAIGFLRNKQQSPAAPTPVAANSEAPGP